MLYIGNLRKQYGGRTLFREVNFHLHPRERVGLVGENGVGKTTLFRLIVGQERPDAGTVSSRKNARLAMLAQDVDPGDDTILSRVLAGDAHFSRVKAEMEALTADSAFHEREPEKWSARYGDLHHEFERLGGYERESRAKIILAGLGFRQGQWDERLARFSGGWRMRAELARLLLQNPDVLLLDEPSNHLDLQSVIWLENFLRNYDGAIILISHDRRFLNGIVNRIACIENGIMTVYKGNYDYYEEQKRERQIQLEQAAANQQRKIDEIERFIERFRAKNTKASQVQSRVKMLEKMERVKTVEPTKGVSFRFPQPARFGRVAVDLQNVRKSYGAVTVYDGLSIHLERGQKVALVGENGAGKSTLLKLMAGVIAPDAGEIKLGANVTRAYYAQHQSETLDPSLTALQTIAKTDDTLSRTRQQAILGAFRFSGDDADKRVDVLSGGERSRLALARMLVFPSSALFLDEPTNHLDMRSCDVLAAALADFEGSLCVISHDRFFLDGFINRVWEVRDGQVRQYPGNYSEYERDKSRERERQTASATAGEKQASEVMSDTQKDKTRKRREAEERNRKYRERRPLETRLKAIEARLEETMAGKAGLDKILETPGIYGESEKTRLLETLAARKKLEAEENDLLAEMERLTVELESV